MCVLNTIYKQYGSNTSIDISKECLKQGDDAASNGDYNQAIKFYREAETFIQTYEEAFSKLVQTWIDLKMYKEAEEHIAQSLKHFPDHVTAHNFKAYIHAYKQEWGKALQSFDKVIELSPERESAYIGKSEVLVKQGRYEEARKVISEFLKINPNSEKANFQAAKACFGLKQYDKAIELFGKVIKLNPQNMKASEGQQDSMDMLSGSESNIFKKAITFLDNNKFQEALPLFEAMIDKEPNAELYFFLGKAYKGLLMYDKAIENFKQSYSMAPYSTDPYVEIADILFTEGKEKDAMEYYEKVLDIDSQNRDANINKGKYLRKMGLLIEAEACYDTILQSDEQDAEVYLLKGIVAIDRYPIAGNPLFYLDKAMELDPNYAMPMYYKGRFQQITAQKPKYALESFNKAAFLASLGGNIELVEKCKDAISELKSVESF